LRIQLVHPATDESWLGHSERLQIGGQPGSSQLHLGHLPFSQRSILSNGSNWSDFPRVIEPCLFNIWNGRARTVDEIEIETIIDGAPDGLRDVHVK
jgi:hypothetical protein